MTERTKRKFKEWLGKVDEIDASIRLRKKGMKLLLIDRLFRGSYEGEPGGLRRKIISKEMLKDGIHLDGETS